MNLAKQGFLALVMIAMHAQSFALDTTCYSNSGAVVATSQSPAWQEDKAVFNEKINNEPAAIAFAHTQSEVQAIIKCARAAGMKAVPRGGGHGYEGEKIYIFSPSYMRCLVTQTRSMCSLHLGRLIPLSRLLFGLWFLFLAA